MNIQGAAWAYRARALGPSTLALARRRTHPRGMMIKRAALLCLVVLGGSFARAEDDSYTQYLKSAIVRLSSVKSSEKLEGDAKTIAFLEAWHGASHLFTHGDEPGLPLDGRWKLVMILRNLPKDEPFLETDPAGLGTLSIRENGAPPVRVEGIRDFEAVGDGSMTERDALGYFGFGGDPRRCRAFSSARGQMLVCRAKPVKLLVFERSL